MRIWERGIAGALALAALGMAALATGGAARAQEPEASGRAPNLYVGVAYGRSEAKDACEGIAGCEQRDDSFGAFAGYWLHPSLALEAGYHNLGEITAPGGTYIRSNVWELLLVGAWHLEPGFAVYGKVGPYRGAQTGGGIFAGPKQLVDAITYAAGAQLDVTKNLGLRGEWQVYRSIGSGDVLPHGDIRVLRVSGLWRFR